MMIYGDNRIAQKISSDVSSDLNERSQSSVRRNDRDTSKYNNQQW